VKLGLAPFIARFRRFVRQWLLLLETIVIPCRFCAPETDPHELTTALGSSMNKVELPEGFAPSSPDYEAGPSLSMGRKRVKQSRRQEAGLDA
jgi:hypothetical protein